MIETPNPDDFDALAAELVLGLLDGQERARAMRLCLSDRVFAEAVETWRQRFEPLHEGFEESPAPDLWPAIERRLAGFDYSRLRRALTRWRIGGIASGALAASLAAFIVLRPTPAPLQIIPAPAQAAIAQLGGEGEAAQLAASYDPAGGVLRIRAVRLPRSTLAPELWVIPADGVPRSLGLLLPSGVSKLAIAQEVRNLLEDGVTLAVTLEPSEGAPHRAPSGAPIAAGKISTI
jgi:anti-sigma-K factor RskA